MHALVMATRTARRTTCHNWVFKGCKVQPGLQFSPALREWESVGTRLKLLGNTAYVARLLLLCQGPKWLNGKSVWLLFSRIQAGSRILFRGCIFSSLSKKHQMYYVLNGQLKWHRLLHLLTSIQYVVCSFLKLQSKQTYSKHTYDKNLHCWNC